MQTERAAIGSVVALGLVIAVIALGGVLLLLSRPAPVQIIINPPIPTPTQTPRGPLLIYVTGAVASPGMVQVAPGGRVQDVLSAAGGAASDADLVQVNLAAFVQDGDQIHVPAQGSSTGSALATPSGGLRININTADATALETLPGIGPITAARIIDYRTANGPFATPEDLMNVQGIGDATFESLAPLIRVD